MLTDAVNTAKSLFQPVWVPGKIIVDHEVGVLQIDPFARGIGGDENPNGRIGTKQSLKLSAFVAMGAAVDSNNAFRISQYPGNLALKVVKSIPVF